MGNRLTKIFTKKGDDGTTDLGGNQRVPKYDQQIEVYGCLDELSAAIGILVAEGDLSENIQAFLINAQLSHRLQKHDGWPKEGIILVHHCALMTFL